MRAYLRKLRGAWRLLKIRLGVFLLPVWSRDEKVTRVLNLFAALTPSDQKLFVPNVASALKQLSIAKASAHKSVVVPVEECLSRKSDCVFILGSGPSINDLSQKDFDHIARNDSWGFNFWFVHEFIPDVYFAQVGLKRNRYTKIMQAWDSCFQKVAAKYVNTKFVLKGADLFYGFDVTESESFRCIENAGVSKISVLPSLLVPKDMSRDPLELFEDLRRTELMVHSSGINTPVPQIRATVGLLFVAAIQMGYKEIVLCGVDGKDRSHFFDQDKYMKSFPELVAIPESYKIEQHPHTVAENTGLSSLDYIVSAARFCEEHFGVKTKIASSDSYLSDKLELYNFKR